ncbi:MAG: AMP-binding protein [Bacteroidia bacterium]|nr:AMP-binding protein [Bacteroidia bacterium]
MLERNFVQTIASGIRDNWFQNAYSDYQGDTYLYKDVAEKIIKFHMIFEKHKIGIGSKIALLGKNSRNWAVTYMAAILNGSVAIPILSDFHREDVQNILNHSESDVLFVSEEYYPGIDVSQLPAIRAVFKLNDLSLLFSREPGLKEDMAGIQSKFDLRFPHGLDPEGFKVPEVSNSEIITINYTSGTAGFSKGVVLNYNAFMANLQYAQDNMPLESGNQIVSFLPLAHTYGCAFDFIFPTSLGCHITFLGKIPSPQVILKAFQEIKPHLVMFVPLVLEKIYITRILPKLRKPAMKVLLNIPGINTIIHKKIKASLTESFGGQFREIVIGGAALNPEVETFLKKIGFQFSIGYGMTECGPLVSYANWRNHRNGASGKAVDTLEMKIDSFDPYNEVGEIMVRGDNVLLEYYKNPEATNASLTPEGWLRTGDLGVFDKDHFIYIKGRSKNMILGPSGQNIYPEEIESKLNTMLYVIESVVAERSGKIVAMVYPDQEVVKSGQITREDLEEQMEKNRISLNNRLTKYMQVTAIELVAQEFEKTPKKSIKRYLYK